MMELGELFSQFWEEYKSSSSQIEKIIKYLEGRGERIVNDHIAFRTYNSDEFNIKGQEDYFALWGYDCRGEYEFKEKRVQAKHLELEGQPKIFISELEGGYFPMLTILIAEILHQAPESWEERFQVKRWWTPSFESYELLRGASEYAAWVYAHGFVPNHFTIDVGTLKSYQGIEDFCDDLASKNLKFNENGGRLKGSRDSGLIQASTKAPLVTVDFKEGKKKVPGRYFEFIERFEKEGTRFEGFLTENADKIFESTNR